MALCLQLFLWFGCVWFTMPLVAGQTCYLGQELKPTDSLRWGLSAKDPCSCSKIDIGGVNMGSREETMLPHSISLDMANAKGIKEAFQCDEMKPPPNCKVLQLEHDGDKTSGVYNISIPGQANPVPVYCDMETHEGGWIVIFRRHDGWTDFQRNWYDYTNGFGNLQGEFWLGNEKIRRVTEKQMQDDGVQMEWELQFELWTVPWNVSDTCCPKLCNNKLHLYERYRAFRLEGDTYQFIMNPLMTYTPLLNFDALDLGFLSKFYKNEFLITECPNGQRVYWWKSPGTLSELHCPIIANTCYGNKFMATNGFCTVTEIWPQYDPSHVICKSEMKIRPVPSMLFN